MARGTLILVIGPMGSGKGTLMRHAVATHPEVSIVPSYTSRARRPEAVENPHYRFISREEYEERIAAGEFLEYAQFSGNYYGTRRADIDEGLAAGHVMLTEMEVQGVRLARELISKEELVTIYIDAGPWEVLRKRALERAPMSDEELEKRRVHFEDELTFMPAADVVIQNREGELDAAKAAFSAVIEEALKRSHT